MSPFLYFFNALIVCYCPDKEQFASPSASSLLGGADAAQGLSYQADERDPKRDQSPEAVRLGKLVQRKDSCHSTEGAERAPQNGLPGRAVHHGLDQRPLPGRGPDV